MKRTLVTIAITSILLSTAAHNAHADVAGTSRDRHKEYIGTGIGATAGALVAGPVGFIVGGVIGNLAGRHDAMNENTGQPPADTILLAEASSNHSSEAASQTSIADLISANRTSDSDSSVNEITDTEKSHLLDVVLPAAELDIFFLSGSTEVEAFYKPRIQAISKLLHAEPSIEVHLEGYSDRRGDNAKNLELSSARVESVLEQLTEAGIGAERVNIRALGEQNFISSPGDLEAYTFDRRVVISLDLATPETDSPLAISTGEQVN
jgi:outer membrane protein OmpA-like peptidoglycan-associated protein